MNNHIFNITFSILFGIIISYYINQKINMKFFMFTLFSSFIIFIIFNSINNSKEYFNNQDSEILDNDADLFDYNYEEFSDDSVFNIIKGSQEKLNEKSNLRQNQNLVVPLSPLSIYNINNETEEEMQEEYQEEMQEEYQEEIQEEYQEEIQEEYQEEMQEQLLYQEEHINKFDSINSSIENPVNFNNVRKDDYPNQHSNLSDDIIYNNNNVNVFVKNNSEKYKKYPINSNKMNNESMIDKIKNLV